MYNYITSILKEITLRNTSVVRIPNENGFSQQLELLEEFEKDYIRKIVYKLEWAIGSSKVLSILQKNDVIRMSEYIIRQNPEIIQNIMNDLFETEFNLLSELVLNAYSETYSSNKIIIILDDSIRLLLTDLLNNPKIINRNYLLSVKPEIPVTFYEKFKEQHLSIFLSLSQTEIKTVVIEQMQWIKDDIKSGLTQQGTILSSILGELTSNRKNFSPFIEQIKSLDFKYFRNYLRLMVVIVGKNYDGIGKIVKDFLNSLFKQFLSFRNDYFFHAALILARQICYGTNSEILGTYAMWYKSVIGEMMYTITVDDFKFTLQTLSAMVEIECDVEILDTQLNIAISSPPYCSDIVVHYKQLLRQRLVEIKKVE